MSSTKWKFFNIIGLLYPSSRDSRTTVVRRELCFHCGCSCPSIILCKAISSHRNDSKFSMTFINVHCGIIDFNMFSQYIIQSVTRLLKSSLGTLRIAFLMLMSQHGSVLRMTSFTWGNPLVTGGKDEHMIALYYCSLIRRIHRPPVYNFQQLQSMWSYDVVYLLGLTRWWTKSGTGDLRRLDAQVTSL